MNKVIQMVLASVVIIFAIAAYVFIIKNVLPRFVIKRRYFCDENLGRGLKKYKSENGRAVVYEPHPSIRKYIKQYALISDGGYKYLECSLDSGVNHIVYNVVMLDRNDKILDVIEVMEFTAKRQLSQMVYLHPDTSYIALTVSAANGERIPSGDISYYRRKDVILFGAAVALLTFALSWVLGVAIDFILHNIGINVMEISDFMFGSLRAAITAGILSVVVLVKTCNKKNVKVVKK